MLEGTGVCSRVQVCSRGYRGKVRGYNCMLQGTRVC